MVCPLRCIGGYDGIAASVTGRSIRGRDGPPGVCARAAGLAFFLACVTISTIFEIARFPDRTRWMLGFASAFVVLSAVVAVLVQRARAWSIVILVVFVNLIGVALNAYHAIVGAPVAMCLWTLTALLGSTVVILRWGGTNQALASIGTLLFYPVHLVMHTADPLTWAAGGTYLVCVAAMSVFGAALYASYVRSGLHLVPALSERVARLQSYFDLARRDGRPAGRRNDQRGQRRALPSPRPRADEIVGLGWFELALFDDQNAPGADEDRAPRHQRGRGRELA
jgi:hypothetical protein